MAHTHVINTLPASAHSKLRYWRRLESPQSGWWRQNWLWLLGLLLTFLYGLFVVAPDIQDNTVVSTRDVLRDAGFSQLKVTADGQEIKVAGAALKSNIARIQSIARGAMCDTWIKNNLVCPTHVSIDLREIAPPPAPVVIPIVEEPVIEKPKAVAVEAPTAPPRYHNFSITKEASAITLDGEVPNEQAHERLVAATKNISVTMIDNLTVSGESATAGFLQATESAHPILSKLTSGGLSWQQGSFSVWGIAPRESEPDVREAYLYGASRDRLGSINLQIHEDVIRCNEGFASVLGRSVIRFNTGSAIVSASSTELLGELADLANDCEMNLQVAGHTDNIGAENLNIALSLARANAVVNELNKLGVDSNRLKAIGYGPSNPIGENDTPTGRARNRRIEIKADTISE